jgi:Zn-finger protein
MRECPPLRVQGGEGAAQFPVKVNYFPCRFEGSNSKECYK